MKYKGHIIKLYRTPAGFKNVYYVFKDGDELGCADSIAEAKKNITSGFYN
jgi:hypothetical protein